MVAAQLRGEQLLAEREALRVRHRVESGAPPHRLRALDDERARPLVERIAVHLEHPVLGLGEDEAERVEHEVGAEPDVLASLRHDASAERTFSITADGAVDPVGGDEQIAIACQVGDVVDLDIEAQIDAQLVAAVLEDCQQSGTTYRREPVAPRSECATTDGDVDRIPAGERVRDLEIRRLVGVPQRAERLLGEHDPPAERGVGRIAFEHGHHPRRVGPLEQQSRVEPCRAGTDDRHVHPAITSASRSSCPMSDTVGNSTSSSHPSAS